jgi:hypothetical protein
MMLTATSVVAALFAFTAFAPAASPVAMPPIIVSVTTAVNLSPQLIARIFAETDAIWRPSGISFLWRRVTRDVVTFARASETGPSVPNTLRLNIGDAIGQPRDGRVPLGWIVFDAVAAPQQDIYLSYANAQAVMEEARGVVGVVAQMPIAQRETLLARAMGRALAHELGHYLLASKEHTPHGLMKAVLSAAELFNTDHNGLRVDPAQAHAIAARLRGEPFVMGQLRN